MTKDQRDHQMSIEVRMLFIQYHRSLTRPWIGYIREENRQRAGASGFWTVEYYQPYFDVDTNTASRP